MKVTQPILPLNHINGDLNGRYNPLPMQYLGSKARIAPWILEQIQSEFPNTRTFVDLFAGTGSVSLAANKAGYRLLLNDIQPYSYIIQRSLFVESRDGLQKIVREIENLNSDDFLLRSGRIQSKGLLNEERTQFIDAAKIGWRWESYRDFSDSTSLVQGLEDEVRNLRIADEWNLFIKYYANTYFGVEQCLQLDTLREYADKLTSESSKAHVIAATITAMTFAVSSTTHLAQYLKASTRKKCINLIRKRRINLIDEVVKRLLNLSNYSLPEYPAAVYQQDFRELLTSIPLNSNHVVYVDPPYFKEHYSRYYHVLDTFFLYDYPELTFNERIQSTTVGRYRQDRIISDFGLKGSVEGAFTDLFMGLKSTGSKAAVSYADTSLVGKSQLLDLANRCGLNAKVSETQLMHSGQGQPRNKVVTEYLFLLEP